MNAAGRDTHPGVGVVQCMEADAAAKEGAPEARHC